jgi:hypothetical protein
VNPRVSRRRERISFLLSSAAVALGTVNVLGLDSERVGLAAALASWVLGTAVLFALVLWGTALWRRKTGG